MSLGSNIKRIRNNRGLTQKELAEKLQVNINTIQNYENGRREPKTKVIENLGKILDVSLSEFFLDDDPKKEEENINKLKSEIPESRKRLINESPSNQKYNDDNCKGENLLDELLKNDALQADSNYNYEKLLFNEDFDNIYIFIQRILQLKYSNSIAASNDDIALELLLNYCGSSTNKFTQDENKIIKNTILNYIKGMIEFKRMNK
ncbi:helix-turn-helix domain-containing protein [Clostridium butyricum]|uniref:HTH cro/C1-type domain-containing protein n=2 Tax=Clostridium butyricum TaxID=1492 RepID=A0A512TLI4_CLOBU|nr:helix-turn-helix transcriptional regulator [Clostridium butyricum]NOW23927.1 transcriptional regulator with XRE-family HTH domain [Clostridium butyricum]GEQ21122.1 hypothetical protein CBU02nite_16280 [Clostridium butyricum]